MRLIKTVMAFVVLNMLLSGCALKKNQGHREIYTYELSRPEWILEDGSMGAPEEIKNKRSTAVRVCDGSAWYGIYGFGIAELKISKKQWKLTPLDIREVFITDFACDGGMVYAAISGHGILQYDPHSGDMKLHRNGIESITNRYYEIVSYDGKIWAPMEIGLFSLDAKRGEFEFVIDGRFYTVGIYKGNIVLLDSQSDDKKIMIINPATKKVVKTLVMPRKEYGYLWMCVEDGKAIIEHLDGIVEVDLESGTSKMHEGSQKMKKTQLSRLTAQGENVFIGSDEGLIVTNTKTGVWRTLGIESGLPSGLILAATKKEGYIFMAMESGPFALSEDSFKQAVFLSEQAKNNARAKNKSGGGVAKDPKASSEWVYISTENGLMNSSITSVLADRDYVWVGSAVTGLDRVSMKDYSVKNLNPFAEKGYAIEPVLELARFNDRIYMAGYSFYGEYDIKTEKWPGGMKRFDNKLRLDSDGLYVDKDAVVMAVRKEGLRIRRKGGSGWEKVEGAYLDTSPFMTDIIRIGDIHYISMDAGIQKFNLELGKFKYLDAGVMDVKSLDGEGSALWLGARERNEPMGERNTGLYRFNVFSGNTVAYHDLPGYKGTHVNKVVVDGPYVWAATDQGLYKLSRMSGMFTAHDGPSGLPPGKVNTLSIYAETVAVGTDAGLFIKPIFQFVKEELKMLYRKAWEDEQAGNYERAAREYYELAGKTGAGLAEHMMYRSGNSYLRGGNITAALNVFNGLVGKYPLMLADLEGLDVQIFEYDAYVANLLKLIKSYKKGSYEYEYCRIHLKGAGPALRRVALKLEKDGDKDRAMDYWRFITRLPSEYLADEEIRREANIRTGAKVIQAKAIKG